MDNSTVTAPSRRIPLQMDVEYRRSYARRGERGRLKNISLTGAFLETPVSRVLAPADKVTITLFVSGRQRQIAAHVVWHSDRGCGLRFVPVNQRDVQIVDDLMYFVESSRETQRTVLDDIFKKVS